MRPAPGGGEVTYTLINDDDDDDDDEEEEEEEEDKSSESSCLLDIFFFFFFFLSFFDFLLPLVDEDFMLGGMKSCSHPAFHQSQKHRSS